MNIRKKLAVAAAAVALPLGGLAAIGGLGAFEAVSAGGPPVLTCSSIGSDPANPLTGGITFDNGSGPGTSGLSLGAGLATTNQTAVDELAGNIGTNVVELGGEAVAGQELVLPNGQDTWVVSDAATETGTIGVATSKNFETAIISPAVAGTTFAKKGNVTIETTSATPYETYDNASVTSGSDVVTATSADFNTGIYNAATNPTGDIGAPVTVTYNDSAESGNYSPFAPPQDSVVIWSTFIENVVGDTAVIYGYGAPAGTTTTGGTNGKGVAGAGNSTATPADSQVSGTVPVVVTVGQTSQPTNTVATDYDMALTQCASSLAADAGVIYPNQVTLTTPTGGSNTDTGPSAAVALEEPGAQAIKASSVNYPSDPNIGGSGAYSWGDGGLDTTGLSFQSTKDVLCLKTSCGTLSEDEESFIDGVATGVYPTAKASMTFSVGAMVVCTEAQTQAIGTGSGGSGIDSVAGPNHVPAASNAGQVGTLSLEYCDGGPDSALTAAPAVDGGGGGSASAGETAGFVEVAGVEGAPLNGGGGFDGYPLAAIWAVTGNGHAVL